MRSSWTDLPGPARAAIEDVLGPVARVQDVTGGQNSDVAVVVHGASGSAFVKAVRGISIRTRRLRNELTAARLTAGLAPPVLAHAEVDGWLVVAFDRVDGRPAVLAPGSPDLPVVADVVTVIGTLPAVGLRSLADRWAVTDWWDRLAGTEVAAGWDVAAMGRLTARMPELAEGDHLVHTDLHGDQILISAGAVHVVDWAMPGAGARWVDPAFLVLRLIEAGHTPGDAEQWVHTHLRPLRDADPDCLDVLAAYLAGMWSCWSLGDNPEPGTAHRARLARRYAHYRLNGVDSGPDTALPVVSGRTG